MKLDSCIPTIKDYHTLTKSNLFLKMESFSNNFLKDNRHLLAQYGRKWVIDSFHQWSRQWEYPFVFDRILKYSKNKSNSIKILDAGSGITFFPYFIASNIDMVTVTCCDFDQSLNSIFANILCHSRDNVEFMVGDIHKLLCQDNLFDVIYSISVLEHTRDFEAIIKEFKRVLKAEGILILTFDISLDGTVDISPQTAVKLIQTINRYLPKKDLIDIKILMGILKSPDILNTKYIRDFDRNLLPWKLTFSDILKSILRYHRLPRSNFKNLTCYCDVFENQSPQT